MNDCVKDEFIKDIKRSEQYDAKTGLFDLGWCGYDDTITQVYYIDIDNNKVLYYGVQSDSVEVVKNTKREDCIELGVREYSPEEFFDEILIHLIDGDSQSYLRQELSCLSYNEEKDKEENLDR